MPANLNQQYQQSAVTQADPVKLVEMMYEGSIRFCRIALKGIEDNDPERAHHHIMRAYAVVAELMATLDFEQGGDIAKQLEQCYDYVLHLLKEADITKDPKHIEQVIAVIEPLLSTWRDAFKNGNPDAQVQEAKPAADKKQQPPGKDEETSAEDADERKQKPLDLIG
jgi:flagellar protein FliS